MPGKVKLSVTEGPMKGKEFVYEEHDAFLFGRQGDCHAQLPNDDCVSRHHFILEVNPPDARVRDLGSLNGTIVNDKKHGGRDAKESPEDAAKRKYPEVDLKDKDRIKVGVTVLQVTIDAPTYCNQCGGEIAPEERAKCQEMVTHVFTCGACRQKLAAAAAKAAAPPPKPKPPEPVKCGKCGKDVSKEIGPARRGNYVCETCRSKADKDPAELLNQLIRQFVLERGTEQAPSITGYDLGARLGVGGFGAVYKAVRKSDNLSVAVKVMLSKVAVDEASRQKFVREIELMKGFQSAHIVPLYDHGVVGSAFYFAMELCACSIADVMAKRRGAIPLSEAAPMMIDTLTGLADAHRKEIVHRDLKPHNLLLKTENGCTVTKISDFGLAKNFSKAGFSGMTLTGSTAGTPPFMPREQVTNFKYVKPPCDVWSIGATFYNMLTGQFPRDFRRDKDPMENVLHSPVVPIRQRNGNISNAVAAVIDKALDDTIARRYQDAGEMLAALQRAL